MVHFHKHLLSFSLKICRWNCYAPSLKVYSYINPIGRYATLPSLQNSGACENQPYVPFMCENILEQQSWTQKHLVYNDVSDTNSYICKAKTRQCLGFPHNEWLRMADISLCWSSNHFGSGYTADCCSLSRKPSDSITQRHRSKPKTARMMFSLGS